MTNKILLVLGAGVVVAGAVAASAATLDLNSDTLGTGTTAVVSCQEDPITVTWGAPTYTTNDYSVASVVLTGVDATCQGLPFSLTLADAAGASLAQSTAPTTLAAAATTTVTTFSPMSVSTTDIENVTLTVAGPV